MHVFGIQDIIQNMFHFLPNGEPPSSLETTDVNNTPEPVYDTPVNVPRPIVSADSQPASTSLQSAETTPSKQTRQKPTPVARVRSSKNPVYVVSTSAS